MKLPLARLESGQVVPAKPKRLPGRKPTPADRDELVRIWDALPDDERKVLLFFAVQLAKKAGLPEGDGPLMRTGKR